MGIVKISDQMHENLRLANAISCSRPVALNTNGVFGLALMATSSCNTLHE